jgi:hypothetical protein
MNHLYDRIPPLPESYIDEILAGEDAVSQLELLEANMAADRHLYHNLGEQIKRTYRSDTTNTWVVDSLLNFMGRDERLIARYELASAQMEFSFSEAANQTLEDIPSAYELSETEAADHEKFTTLFGIKSYMMGAEIPVGVLNEGQVADLMNLVEENRPQLTANAVALLKMNDPEFVFNEIILEPDTNSVPKRQRSIVKDDKEALLKLYPNPAYDYITIVYDLDLHIQSTYTLQLYNALGQLLFERELGRDTKELIVGLGEYSPGNYNFILMCDGKILTDEKFTIIR